ncbi:MAG: glycosyltransferase [Chloroflexi bacterium]|nr:glycosyltransferase [Chloroflexota bacterium]
MRKVLIISRLFPLWQGGSPRVLGLAKHLPEFGWQPIILTTRMDDKSDQQYRVVETDYRDALAFWRKLLKLNSDQDIRWQVRKRLGVTNKKSPVDFLLTRAGEIVNYPDPDKGWKRFAVRDGDRVVREEHIEALISSSSPVTGHLAASALKARHGIPWVADLRDPWSQNHNYPYSPLRRLFDRRLELRTLSRADALVTVSEIWAENLATLHQGKPVYAITNGFDPAEVNVPPARLTPNFTITYTGSSLYPGKLDPAKVFAALGGLIRDGVISPGEVEVRFFSPKEDWLVKEAQEHGLTDVVRQYGMVPRPEALQKQRESQVLLIINWEGKEGLVGHPSKLFEYLAAQRPVLATGGAGNYLLERILKETGAGVHAPTAPDIRANLADLYREYKAKGRVAYRGHAERIDKYSYREMARRFSEILGNHLN